MDLRDLPSGTIPADVLEAILSRALAEAEQLAGYKKAEVERGQETPRLAALQFAKFGLGMTTGLGIAGIDAADLQKRIDALSFEIDPNFTGSQDRRWRSRPADLLLVD